MNTRIARLGTLTGIFGGVAMALFAMTATALSGHGFFTLTNVIAHTLWHGAPLDGEYVFSALVIGLAVHLVVSITVGTVIAFFVERGSLDGGIVFLVAVVIGVGAWMTQSIVWPRLDDAAHNEFIPWVLAVAHVVFAVGGATALQRLGSRVATDDVGADLAPRLSGAPLAATEVAPQSARISYRPFE